MSATAPSTLAPPPPGGARFGTLPVFLTSLSTILGAILFLRFAGMVVYVLVGVKLALCASPSDLAGDQPS